MADTTSYLLRDIPKSFWKKVKMASYDKRMSIRDYILEVLKADVDRETNGKETDKKA